MILALALASLLQEPSPDLEGGRALVRPHELIVEWAEGRPPIHVPRGERLVYRVSVGIGFVAAPAGKVTLTAGAEPYRESVLLLGARGSDGESRETGWMRAHAEGNYLFYTVDANIESRIHPVDWPRIVYNYASTGTEKRRRQILIGRREDELHARYRKDTHRGAPRGTRIWRVPQDRALPEAALDMLTAVYYARTLVLEDRETLTFPLLDKLHLWQVDLTRGKRKVQKTYAGSFDTVEIILAPQPYPGEDMDEEREAKFEGLFGIRGSIHLWVEERTGVPVRVQGDVPIGPIDLAVNVVLKSYSGTAPEFLPRDQR